MNIDPNTAAILAIALLNAYTAFSVRKTRIAAELTERNTNSMKDALVKATAESAHSAGKEEGRAEGELKAANLAEGKLSATP